MPIYGDGPNDDRKLNMPERQLAHDDEDLRPNAPPLTRPSPIDRGRASLSTKRKRPRDQYPNDRRGRRGRDTNTREVARARARAKNVANIPKVRRGKVWTTYRIRSVKVTNTEDLQRKVVRMVEDALDAGKREGRAIAPVKTGRLRSGIQTPNYLPPHIEGGKVSKPTSAYAYRQLEVIDEVPYAKYQEERFRFMQKFFRTVRGETTVKQVTGKCSMQVVVDVKNLIPGTPRAGGTRGDYVLSGVREGTLTGKPDDRITLRATPNKGLQIVRDGQTKQVYPCSSLRPERAGL